MTKELHKSLINYFVHLKILDEKWLELFTSAERPLQALRNQCEQLRFVSSKDVDSEEICMIDYAREKLIFKIFMGIENEISLLSDMLQRLNDAIQDLKNRLTNLNKSRNNVLLRDEDMKDIINGTPYRPKLNLLLEWAIESFQYYHELYLFINESMKAMDYKNEESIDNFADSFIEDRYKRTKLNRILAFTQFLIMEKVQ
ncbi:uncharacterized protein V1477_004990 [Vespula maculifrons]|uniref:Uncharacterized protein n=1 Tax=Vespula maculifrons TaxID=7453 RepID=A0ABD2CPI3_VESMC|nr:uncharacterized protein LOC122627160 [Vespula pensylvanica]XP_043664009.1 uncharacterized protein LOC122627160 [Vespula pensylvanica]XP_043664010.1 uncharacterized protein LOC122627160 [Vespula pensylvanica]XP_043664011.1 uncharacterized protein LOC122627160 [Vespula pensylvanica]XP_043664012.1 uncharacterized protein LOC122627160 [Vespula pensylvanica]XP_050869458.1 uncharacterized protein LOC127072785 [Vespula vulgaris]